MNQQFDINISGAIELSDAELGQIQGGNILGDIWDGVKHAAGFVANQVTSAVDKVASAIRWLTNPKPFTIDTSPWIVNTRAR